MRFDKIKINAEFLEIIISFYKNEIDECICKEKLLNIKAIRFIEEHNNFTSINQTSFNKIEFIDKILKEKISEEDLYLLQKNYLFLKNAKKLLKICIDEVESYLPEKSLENSRFYMTINYDIGVALNNECSLNLFHDKFRYNIEELIYYLGHELHHTGFQKFHKFKPLAYLKTTDDLLELIKYLTVMEGIAVHSMRNLRKLNYHTENDNDYKVLNMNAKMKENEKRFFYLLNYLSEKRNRKIEKEDWEIISEMSSGNRLWYVVGAYMCDAVEKKFGKEKIISIIKKDYNLFFDIYNSIKIDK